MGNLTFIEVLIELENSDDIRKFINADSTLMDVIYGDRYNTVITLVNDWVDSKDRYIEVTCEFESIADLRTIQIIKYGFYEEIL